MPVPEILVKSMRHFYTTRSGKSSLQQHAFLGFNMLKEYCSLKSLSFKQDGVLEVATYDKGIDRLHKYLEWGYSNGLQKNEIQFLEKDEVHDFEPNVKCLAGIYCSKDGFYRLWGGN